MCLIFNYRQLRCQLRFCCSKIYRCKIGETMFYKLFFFGGILYLCTAISTVGGVELMVLPLGVTRKFACTSPPGTDYAIVWKVNGTSAANALFEDYITLGEVVHLDIDALQKNLTLTANTSRVNNTLIECNIYPFGGEEYTAVNMNIILQGELSLPAVDMSRDQRLARFSWSAPFTLNISDVEPDILHYVVYIIRDDGHNETVNTTDTHYELQADPCQSHQYHVEIAAVNAVGEGEKYRSSEIVLDGYAVASVSETTVSFNGRVVLIQITFEASPHCHEMDLVNYAVELSATYSSDRLLFNSSGNAMQHTLNLNSNDDSLSINELYNCLVWIKGLPNSKSERIELSTFGVQPVSIHYDDQLSGYVEITCYFTKGSDAKGCTIVAQSVKNNTKSCEFVASREDRDESTVTVALPNGIYTLLVYEDGAVHNPAFTTTLHVQSSPQVSECTTVAHDDKFPSPSTPPTKYVILVGALASSIILIAGVATAIIFMCVCKRKGNKHLPEDTKWNEYSSVPVQRPPSSDSTDSSRVSNGSDSSKQSIRSSSSESTDSSRISSGSDSSEQSIHVQSTGHSHDLQYADVHVTMKRTMPRPPPASNDEPVNYAILQHKDTSSHSNTSQGTMDAGQLPGSYTPDDSN